jgi:hypothetical protein
VLGVGWGDAVGAIWLRLQKHILLSKVKIEEEKKVEEEKTKKAQSMLLMLAEQVDGGAARFKPCTSLNCRCRCLT